MLRSRLIKHLLKADILLRGEFEIIPVDSGICRCRASDPLFRGCHQSGSLSGVTREHHPASQSEHLSYAEKLFGIQRCSLCEAGAAPKSRPFFKLYMDTNRKLTDITDKKPRTPSYKYSSRLNEEQHIRFNELLCKAGSEHNRSRFIVKRIFGEVFVVVRRDPSKVQFVARLNDFYFQFQKLANNCAPVKAI